MIICITDLDFLFLSPKCFFVQILINNISFDTNSSLYAKPPSEPMKTIRPPWQLKPLQDEIIFFTKFLQFWRALTFSWNRTTNIFRSYSTDNETKVAFQSLIIFCIDADILMIPSRNVFDVESLIEINELLMNSESRLICTSLKQRPFTNSWHPFEKLHKRKRKGKRRTLQGHGWSYDECWDHDQVTENIFNYTSIVFAILW